VEGLITHRYPLERYADAFLAAYNKPQSQAIKVVFDPSLNTPAIRTEQLNARKEQEK
jgi:hypothetical protein